MKCFSIDVASRFEIKTEVELTEHNMGELALCQVNGERYRIRRGTLDGRDVVIVHVANSWWDKLMSYLPSCCLLRKRFISQLSYHVKHDEGIHSRVSNAKMLGVKVPFLSSRGLEGILACRTEQKTTRSEDDWRALYQQDGIQS